MAKRCELKTDSVRICTPTDRFASHQASVQAVRLVLDYLL
jgi:hypothetical protein